MSRGARVVTFATTAEMAGEGLKRILDGPVDVGSADAVTNPYLKASIDSEKVLIVE